MVRASTEREDACRDGAERERRMQRGFRKNPYHLQEFRSALLLRENRITDTDCDTEDKI